MPSTNTPYNEVPQHDEAVHQTSPSWRAVFLGAASQVGSFFSSIFYGIKVGVQGLWGSLKHIADLKWWTGAEQNQQPPSLLEKLVAEYELPVGHKIFSFNDESSLELLLLSRLETPYNEDSDGIDDFLSERLLQEITILDFSHIVLSPRQPDFNHAMVTLLQRNPHITAISFHADDIALIDDTIQKQLNNNKCLAVCNALLSANPTDERYEQRHLKGVLDALLNDIPARKITEAATFSLLDFEFETFNSSRAENERKQALQVAYRTLLQAFDTHNESLDECQDEFICAYAACDVREVILPTVLLNRVKPDADIFIERFLVLNPVIIKVTREDGLPLLSSTQQLLQERQIQHMSRYLLRAGAQGASTTKLSVRNAERIMHESAMFNRLTQHFPQEQKKSGVKVLSPSLIDKFCGVFSQLTAGLSAYISSFMPVSESAERKATNILPHSNSFETISGALGSTQQLEAKSDEQEPEFGLEELKNIGRDLGIDFPFDDVQFEEKKKREVERIYALITDYEREPNRGKLYDEVYPEILYKGLLGRKNMQYSDRVYSRDAQLNAEMANIKLLIDDPLKLCKIKQFLVYPDKNPALKEKAEKVSRFVNDMKDWISAQANCSRLWPHDKEQAEYAVYLFQLAQGCRIDREIKLTKKNYKKEMEVVYSEMHREIDDLIKFYQDLSGTYQDISQRQDASIQKVDMLLKSAEERDETSSRILEKLQKKEPLTEEEKEIAKAIKKRVKEQEKLSGSQEGRNDTSIFSGVGHFSASMGVKKSSSEPLMIRSDNLYDEQLVQEAAIQRSTSMSSLQS